MSTDKTHFGFREVAPEDKARLVRGVFDSVASRYDLMNDLMSVGSHRLWKRHFVATSGIRRGQRVLDLAAGTGDIGALLAERVGEHGEVVLADFNAAMLAVGRERLDQRGICANVDYVIADAEQLPFADGDFDAVTIAFGLRNVTDQPRALREMVRVLRPGGRVLVLEFSRVRGTLPRRLYDLYSFQILPRMGGLVADDADSYRYLAESIRRHPDQQTLRGMMLDAGCHSAGYRNLSGGIVAIHCGLVA